MRILTVAPCPFPAGRGSQLLIERTADGLAARGHQVEILAPRFGETGRNEPVPVRRAGLPRLGRRIDSRPDLRRAIDDLLLLGASLRDRPDVIVGHNVEGGVVAGVAGRLLAIPTVYVRHTDFGRELSILTGGSRVVTLLGRELESLADRLCTRVVQLAPHPTNGARPPLDVIPPPADPSEPPVEPADGHTLYYEGNLDPYQNPSWLEAALERARRVDPRAQLVRGHGPSDRPRAADVALVPRSIPGGFPMKLLAYQVAGVAAVCVESGAPGMVDGHDAFVVPGSGSPEAFAERVAEALQDPGAREEVRTRARERALSRNDPAGVARRLESVLTEAFMAARGPRSYTR